MYSSWRYAAEIQRSAVQIQLFHTSPKEKQVQALQHIFFSTIKAELLKFVQGLYDSPEIHTRWEKMRNFLREPLLITRPEPRFIYPNEELIKAAHEVLIEILKIIEVPGQEGTAEKQDFRDLEVFEDNGLETYYIELTGQGTTEKKIIAQGYPTDHTEQRYASFYYYFMHAQRMTEANTQMYSFLREIISAIYPKLQELERRYKAEPEPAGV